MPNLKIISNDKKIIFTSRLLLGVIFVYTGISKIIDPSSLESIINSYKMIPPSISSIIAIVLPWIELIGGLFLISGILVKQTALLLSSLLVAFIVVIAINLFRGTFTQCGCFGSAKNSANPLLTGIIAIIRDVFFLILGVVLFIQKQPHEPPTKTHS
jgi:putative oxidoreductase